MPETTNFNIPFLDGTELVRDYPTFSEDLANAVDGNLLIGTTSDGTNTALGDGALESNTTGIANTAVGQAALQNNTEGEQNTAVGQAAMRDNTTGSQNTAVGRRALQNNTTGNNNTAVGRDVLLQNTTGDNNTGIGRRALFGNTTGVENAAVGVRALENNTTGASNAAVGIFALNSCTTGSENVAFGKSALSEMDDSIRNTGLGRLAGNNLTSGNNNTMVGFNSQPSSATAFNEVTLGDGNITSLRCNQTSISSLSDVRDKTDIETTALGLEVINKVRPVEFTWARRDGTMGNTRDLGFIAQELAEVEDDLGETDRLRLTLRENPEKLEAAPGRLLPVLVKAVQELSAQNDELRARLDAVEAN